MFYPLLIYRYNFMYIVFFFSKLYIFYKNKYMCNSHNFKLGINCMLSLTHTNVLYNYFKIYF